jgi:hypothetical protein
MWTSVDNTTDTTFHNDEGAPQSAPSIQPVTRG